MKLKLKPTFPKKGALELFEGVRSSVFGSDLNNDNLMDIVIGNYTGGVSYYKGDTTGITTGIVKHLAEEFEVLLFPNPCNENLTLNFELPLNNNSSAHIYNLTGQLISDHQLNKGKTSFSLNTANLSSGVYVVAVTSQNHKVVKKFVVSH